MPNTPGGLPYPVPTDPLKDGADAIQALALATDAQVLPRHSCKAKQVTPQAMATAPGGVPVILDGEDWDTDAFHDPAVNNTRLTIPAGMAGIVLLHGAIFWPNPSTYPSYGQGIRKNGLATLPAYLSGGGVSINWGPSQDQVGETLAIDLAAPGDYYELMGIGNATLLKATFSVVYLTR